MAEKNNTWITGKYANARLAAAMTQGAKTCERLKRQNWLMFSPCKTERYPA